MAKPLPSPAKDKRYWGWEGVMGDKQAKHLKGIVMPCPLVNF